jgi:multisubunit Na+/H+ antiporter MnhG subunit
MDYLSISAVIASDPELKSSYRTAKITSFVGTACLVISILLILYQFLYGQTKTNLIIWVILLLASIFLSILARSMMRKVLVRAERVRLEKMNQQAKQERPEVDGY